MNTRKLLKIAAKISRIKVDNRNFCLGAVAIRNDDVIVYAYNGNAKTPERKAHCEARLARKLDKGSIVYLARTNASNEWANSKPCLSCENILRRRKVKRIYYTIGPNEWGVIHVC